MKKLLFIGGTSFFGRQAVKKLIETNKYEVTILTRGNVFPAEFKDRVNFIICDRSDKEALAKLLVDKSFDIIVDNIAYTAIDVKNILNIFRGKIEHYLLCSTGAVYPEYIYHEWEESEAVLEYVPGQGSYANHKREAEAQLNSYSDVPYTIYRPTVIEGPEDPIRRTLYFVKKIAQQELFYIPPGIIFKHVYSDDVAQAIVHLVNLGATNKAYNICGDDKILLEQYCDMIAHLLSRAPSYEIVPIEKFRNFNDEDFPNSYDRTLLLSNTLLKDSVAYQATPMDRWLPITIQWNLELIAQGGC